MRWRQTGIVLGLWFGAGVDAAPVALHHYDHESVLKLNQRTLNSIADDSNILLFQRLSPQPVVEEVPLARTERQMLAGQHVCSLNRVRNPQRDALFLFSLPVNFYLGHRLYLRADAPPLPAAVLNAQGEVLSIHALLKQQRNSRVLVPEEYSFGALLDGQLAQVPLNQRISIARAHYFQQLVGMLMAERADYAVLNTSALNEKYRQGELAGLRSYAIAGEPALISGHLMCARSPITRHFLQRVDQHLRALYQQPEFFLIHRRYLPAAEGAVLEQHIRDWLRRQPN